MKRKLIIAFIILGLIIFIGFLLIPANIISNKQKNFNPISQNPVSNTINLTQKDAEEFIAKYFPAAYIPGKIEGEFVDNKTKKRGYAKCEVPAMGAKSEGAESFCEIRYF